MVFCGSGSMERIYFNADGNKNSAHFIDLTMSIDDPTFLVTCCCDSEWVYEFYYDKTSYEQIKFNIMETIFQTESMDELLSILSSTFEEGFADILVDDHACDDDCEHCAEYVSESKYLN